MSRAALESTSSVAGDDEQWAPLSDLMAALMLIFMFIAIVFARTIVQEEETYKAECNKILASFKAEFGSDFEKWDVDLLDDLTIRFRNPDILFESGRAEVRPHYQDILQSFFPRYLSITNNHAQTDEVREIRIEGHTSSAWMGESEDDAYFKNMALSQDRTRSILRFVMALPLESSLKAWAKPLITANGLSSSKLVLNALGREDAARSRRVEFRLITAACQKAGVYEPPTDKRVQFRIDDSGVSERLRSLREAVGAQRADFRPRRSRVVDEDIAANELEERANEEGYLEVKGSPTFAYIRDHTEKKLSEWGGPDGMKKLHFMFCETLVGMKEQGRFERFRATNTTSDKYEVDVGADRVSSHGSGVQEEVRLYPCRNCLRKADYQGYSSASNEERTKIVHDFNAPEAMDVLWQRFDLFRQEMAGVKSAHSPTGYPDNWRQTSKAFRQLNGWLCSKCGVYLGDADAQELLHVHHVDGDKRNNNFMCLCKECHSKEPNHHYIVLSEEDLQRINRARGQLRDEGTEETRDGDD